MAKTDASYLKLHPAFLIAAAVAAGGMAGLLLVDHGPWNRPAVEKPAAVQETSTAEAAKAAGATVTPTDPKPVLEPASPGPKPVQPAAPSTSRRDG